MRSRWCSRLVLACVPLVALACDGDNPMTPSIAPTVAPAAPPNPSVHTVAITGNGVSPQLIRIEPGDRVLFINNDAIVHEMSSDQHPSHLECPSMNQVGYIVPGQSRETGNFVTARTCTYHDHLDALNPRFLGAIVIEEE